ncbi:hypothetical protein ABZP36_030402 [Zizania latifolia]
MATPETLEVRCAGCGETLEVEPGVTEFACPGCAMPQSLPPELMPPPPPPPRPRRALPLHGGRGAAGPGGPMPCGGCGAVLAVPRGLRRLACPACGADLAVDGDHLRLYGASDSGGVQVIFPAVAVPLAPVPLRRSEEELVSQAIRLRQVKVGKHGKPVHLEQRQPFPAHSVHREDSISSLRSNTRTPSHPGYAKNASVNQSFHREESRIKLSNETVSMHDFRKKARLYAGSPSIRVEKIRVEHHGSEPNGSDGSQKARHAAISRNVEKETVEPPSETASAEQVHIQSSGNTTGWNQKQKGSRKTTGRNHNGKDRGSSSSNEGVHLTCGKHSTMEPEDIRISNLMEQPVLSPSESQIYHANNDKISSNICTSSVPQKQMPQVGSNELDNTDAPLASVFINHGTSQDDCFPQCYSQYHADAIGTLAKELVRSAQEHEMHPGSSNGTFHHGKSGALEQHMQEHFSDSDQVQVECHHNKIAGRHKSTVKGVMYLPNERNYIDQVTFVTTFCDPTTSSPLLTATPLPRVTLPSVLAKQSIHEQPLHRQPPYNRHSQAVSIGSINKLPKKRGGRGPTKLIEPRKESDRPLLTPNNVDTWDVHPPCSKVASTISALLKQWHPGSTYVSPSEQTKEVHQGELVLHFHHYPSDTRDVIMDGFLQRYKWATGHEAQCLKLFDRKAVRQYTGLLCDEKRRARVELAESRKGLEALDAPRSNRQTNMHNESAREELKQPRRDPAAEGFKQRLEKAGDTELDPHLVWAEEIGGRNRGRYYGLHGIIDKARLDALSKSIPGSLDQNAHQQMFTQNQVQEMINHAMQQLNETWEKRFQSLLQSMHGMVSLYVPQHAPRSSTAGPEDEDDQISHEYWTRIQPEIGDY